MEALFRLNGAVRHSEAIDAWLATREPALGDIARHWFARMRQCGDDVRELMHDGCPVACVEDAAFAYVNVFKAHVNVGFYHGADLPDPEGLLEGTGRRMRHVKIRPGANMGDAALGALIDQAYTDIRWRRGTSP
jgi:hypothetical protein